MNIIRGNRKHAQAERADSEAREPLGRRGVLGGLAAIPVLYGLVGAATPASATPTQPDDVPSANGELERGEERRYHAPQLTRGTRLLLPAGVKAVSVQDYYHGPYSAPVRTAWPQVTATDGTTVDASVIPERGAPTRIAVLSGFTQGWYELSHANGRDHRVTWDAHRFPFVWLYGEFGGTDEYPYDRFYTLALQPLSLNPYPCKTPAK
ncbi:hypothetical protein ACFV23_01700 [Streptomyces sp. NPDC059627]